MELIVLEILMLKSLFSVIVHEFIYDLQSHETILTGRLERKDAIAFSYKKKQKTTRKMCHESQSNLSASSKNGLYRKKRRYNLQDNYPQKRKKEKNKRRKDFSSCRAPQIRP